MVWKDRKTTQDTESKTDLYRELSHTREAAIVNRGKKNKTGDKDERFLLALMFAPVWSKAKPVALGDECTLKISSWDLILFSSLLIVKVELGNFFHPQKFFHGYFCLNLLDKMACRALVTVLRTVLFLNWGFSNTEIELYKTINTSGILMKKGIQRKQK